MRRPYIDAELARAAARRAVPLLIGSLVASPVHAQQPLVTRPLDSASVVRLELARGGRVEAVLLAPFAPESSGVIYGPPRYRECGVPRSVCRFRTPAAEVRVIEVPRGNRAARSALVGAAIGGGLGLALGLAVTADDGPCVAFPGAGCDQPSHLGVISLTTLVGAGIGAGLGALFGLGSPAWRPAP